MKLVFLYFVLAAVWLVFLIIGSPKYRRMIKPLKTSDYPLKDLYPAGMAMLGLIGYSYRTALDKKRLEQAKLVYGEKYGEYYYRINVAEKITTVTLFIALAPILGALLGDPVISLLGLLGAGIAYYYADSKITDAIKMREYEIARDFSDMVSKMALLINAGMITREAWEEIAVTGEGTLYNEMRQAVIDMQNGESEVDAYIAFGNRCGVQYIRKFISMLVQNLSKGNRELVDFLKAETATSWEEKKQAVRQQGEKAGSKLMIPLTMILIGVFIMILVPIVSNMGL